MIWKEYTLFFLKTLNAVSLAARGEGGHFSNFTALSSDSFRLPLLPAGVGRQQVEEKHCSLGDPGGGNTSLVHEKQHCQVVKCTSSRTIRTYSNLAPLYQLCKYENLHNFSLPVSSSIKWGPGKCRASRWLHCGGVTLIYEDCPG